MSAVCCYCTMRRLSPYTSFLKRSVMASPGCTSPLKDTLNLPDLPNAPSSTPVTPLAVVTCSRGHICAVLAENLGAGTAEIFHHSTRHSIAVRMHWHLMRGVRQAHACCTR